MDSHNAEQFAFENPIDAVGHAQLRHVMTLDHKLSDGAYRTFAMYLKYAHQNPACWPSIERISQDRGKATVTISRHNKELEDLGYIQRKRRTGLTTLTVIRDLNQVPRLKAIAAQELESRISKDVKNDRTNISKMTGKTCQKCYVEEESIEEESSEELRSPTATETPSTFQEWMLLVRDPAANKPALVRAMHQELYPDRDPPDYGYCGKVARRVGGYEVLMMRLWELSPRPPVGNVLAYVQGMKKGKDSNGRHDKNAAIIERARQKCRQPKPEEVLEAEYVIL